MNKTQMTEVVLAAKKKKGTSWAALAEHLGMTDIWVASCAYGENSMPRDLAKKFCGVLDLDGEVTDALAELPMKGNSLGDKIVPTDPLLYRFYEILCVYGTSIKDVIHERFGDGIMSAIDFTMSVEKDPDPKGDRVVINMSGKFLPYKRF